MSKRELIESAKEIGIQVIKARNSKDANRIGVHLLNPTAQELESAIYTAERDMFPAIVIHNSRTWPQADKAAA
jgi:ribonucleotide monophosphatase NagD (HAD superfamily)